VKVFTKTGSITDSHIFGKDTKKSAIQIKWRILSIYNLSAVFKKETI